MNLFKEMHIYPSFEILPPQSIEETNYDIIWYHINIKNPEKIKFNELERKKPHLYEIVYFQQIQFKGVYDENRNCRFWVCR